jgi:heme-degrading monooxygenase HmoA
MRSFKRPLRPGDFAVVFSSQRTDGDGKAYGAMAERMAELAATQPGYVGIESTRGADGFGITVSYWESEEAIRNWKAHAEHQVAQRKGREQWYARFNLVVTRVERAYGTGSTQ